MTWFQISTVFFPPHLRSPPDDCCKITEAEVNLIFYNISLRYKSWIEASWANIDPVSLHSPDTRF